MYASRADAIFTMTDFTSLSTTSFACRVGMEPGTMQRTMFGPMLGPGNRYYSVGAILTHVTPGVSAGPKLSTAFELCGRTRNHVAAGSIGTAVFDLCSLSTATFHVQGGKHRISGQYDVENGRGKSTLLSDVFGDGRLRVQGQLVDTRKDAGPEWGVTTTLRGEDYTAVARLKHGPEAGISYNQRLAPGSPVTLGGEMFFNLPALQRLTAPESGSGKPAAGPGGKPIEWAVGAAYDADQHKTAVHLATTGSFNNVISAHHLYRVTDRSHLAVKFMCTPSSWGSMAAAGYRMKFKNTATSLHGVVDTYGTVRTMVEREPIKDVKIGASMEARLGPNSNTTGPEGAATFGFRISVGAPSPIVGPVSPCTMARDIFSAT